MSKLLKYVAATFVAVTLMTSPSSSFEGFSIGIIGNSSTFDVSGSEREGQGPNSDNELNTGASSKDVDFPSLFIEASGGTAGGFGMTVGLEYIPGEHSIGTKSRADVVGDSPDGDAGTYTANAEVDKHLTLYFEPTFMLNDNLGFYGKLGASHIDIKSLESIAIGADSSTYGDTNAWGGMYGAGFKAVHGSGLFIKLEATKTEYSEVKLKSTSGTGLKIITAKPEQTSTRLAIGYNF